VGLFDKALKNVVGGALGNAVNDVLKGDFGQKLEEVTGLDLNKDGTKSARDPFGTPQSIPDQTPGYSSTPASRYEDGSTRDRAYFKDLLTEKFPSYLDDGAGVAVLPSTPRTPDFVLYKDAKPAVGIFLTEKGRYRNQAFRDTKTAYEANGIIFMNFFDHMPNERGYIINRVRTALGI
jgi:hypothetical protein